MDLGLAGDVLRGYAAVIFVTAILAIVLARYFLLFLSDDGKPGAAAEESSKVASSPAESTVSEKGGLLRVAPSSEPDHESEEQVEPHVRSTSPPVDGSSAGASDLATALNFLALGRKGHDFVSPLEFRAWDLRVPGVVEAMKKIGHAEAIDEVAQQVLSYLAQGYTPSPQTFASLLEACVLTKNVESVRRLFQCVVEGRYRIQMDLLLQVRSVLNEVQPREEQGRDEESPSELPKPRQLPPVPHRIPRASYRTEYFYRYVAGTAWDQGRKGWNPPREGRGSQRKRAEDGLFSIP